MPLNPSPFRLLFLDLDGTLVGKDDTVSPRTLKALTDTQDAGCTVVICTARDRYGVRNIAAQWKGHGYAVLSNGAVIVEWETGRILHKALLSSRLARHVIEIAHEHGHSPLCFGVHVEEDGGERVYTDGRFPQTAAYLMLDGKGLVHRADLKTATDLEPVSMGVYAPREQAENLAIAWRQALGGEVSVFASPSPRYNCWCAYLHTNEADKVHGAKWVSEMLGIPRENTMAIGDHLNDLELLRWAGLGVCMGDGNEEVRDCADHVTGTQAEDGVAQAIERFVL